MRYLVFRATYVAVFFAILLSFFLLISIGRADAASVTFDVGITVEGCNNNLVCEPGLGEDAVSCSNDCTNFQCSNGIDDDNDGLIDYPNDPDCASVLDDREAADYTGGGGGGGAGTAQCSLSISPTTITSGDTALLAWSSTEATLSREIVPDLGAISSAGSVVVSPPGTTTYIGTFVGLRNTVECTATLTVLPQQEESGVVQFQNATYTVSETAGFITLGIERVSGNFGSIAVSVQTAPGSASGRDFGSTTVELLWDDGESGVKTVTIPIFRDVIEEADEVFTVAISSNQPAILGDPIVVPVTIVDVVTQTPTASLTLTKRVINDDAGTRGVNDFILIVNGEQVRSGSTLFFEEAVAATVSERDVSGYDFVSVVGTLGCPSLLPGVVNLEPGDAVVCVITNDDIPVEPDEPGVLRFPSNIAYVSEGGRLDFVVSRNDGSAGSLTAIVQHENGTAVVDQDFLPVSETVFWRDGESGAKVLSLRTIQDNLIEGNESFVVYLSSDEALVEEPYRLTVVIVDNDQPDEECIGDDCFIVTPSVGQPPVATEITEPVISALQFLRNIFDNPRVRDFARVSSGVGILAGLGSFLQFGFGLQNLWLSILRLVSLLLSAVGIKKKARPWGTVYDSITKQPLDPAYVSLVDEDGKEAKGVITDIDGRYGFLVQPGKYRMMAKKTNYTFPSERLLGQDHDELYQHLYFGEWLEIKEEGEVIAKDIPMDPDGFDWNEFAKRDMKVMRFYRRRDLFIARVVRFLFIAGLIFSFFAFLFFPQPYNFIVFLLYNGMMFLGLLGLRPKKAGVILDRSTGHPLSFAVVRVIADKSGNEVAHTVTDAAGRYYKLIADGVYRVRIEKKLSEEHFEPVFESQPITIKRGILNKNFSIEIKKKPL